jgi:dethiobiotin synthetase
MRLSARCKPGQIVFVTGTDTGVGKTLITALLLHHLRTNGIEAVAIKPFCSGDTSDVRLLQGLQRGTLSDHEVNPYSFREPIAPLVAARRQGLRVTLRQVLRHLVSLQARAEVVLVEGAGGLLTPLGEGFSLNDLVVRCIDSRVIVVARNRLGAINHTLLTVERLKQAGISAVEVVLTGDELGDASARTNRGTIREIIDPIEVRLIPCLGPDASCPSAWQKKGKNLKKTLAQLADFAMNGARSQRETGTGRRRKEKDC